MVARIACIFLNIAFTLQGGYQSMDDASWEISFFGQLTNRKARFSARSKFQNLETSEQRLTCLLGSFSVTFEALSAAGHWVCPIIGLKSRLCRNVEAVQYYFLMTAISFPYGSTGFR